jgi:hypothetical protein
MSVLSSVMIENAYKNYNFCSLPEFFDFPLSRFFFPEKFFRTITNKKKCISITKKHFQFFPNFRIFRATFPVFLYIKTSYGLLRTLKKKFAKSFQPFPQKKALSVFPEFSNFPGNFSDFFFFLNHP